MRRECNIRISNPSEIASFNGIIRSDGLFYKFKHNKQLTCLCGEGFEKSEKFLTVAILRIFFLYSKWTFQCKVTTVWVTVGLAKIRISGRLWQFSGQKLIWIAWMSNLSISVTFSAEFFLQLCLENKCYCIVNTTGIFLHEFKITNIFWKYNE